MKDVDSFTNKSISTIKSVAREHAIHNPTGDNGMSITITNNDIKSATGKKRIKQPVIQRVVENFKNAGMEAEVTDNGVRVNCRPLLENKGEYTLKEIEERKSIIDDMNTIQASKYL